MRVQILHGNSKILLSRYYFCQDAKSSLTKRKKYLLQTFYRTTETSKLELFTKKVTVYNRKRFSQKVPP